jgi:hypothetical protein
MKPSHLSQPSDGRMRGRGTTPKGAEESLVAAVPENSRLQLLFIWNTPEQSSVVIRQPNGLVPKA